ncbi:MAG TPA: DUF6569 family protein [Pyrinomonadaceae bacterium]|nr:DUF6569 family protein [Pyrinomonadaceae bacterium]
MIHNSSSRMFLTALCVCALVAGVLMTANAPQSVGLAKGPQRARAPWTVLAPISYKNLTIFPVRAGDAVASADYITLDEGTRSGTVVITEKGAVAGRTRRGGSNRQVSYNNDNASVNELALVNKSGKKLLLLAGEVIVGGKQDRIVQEDRIIPPVSVPVALSVFCVEHGRWSPRTVSHAVGGGGRGSAAGRGVQAPVVQSPMEAADESASPSKFSSLGAVAHPKLRGAAQDKKVQSEVWKEVSANNQKLGTANSTDTYQEVYASKEVGAQMDDYIRVLEKEVLQPGVVGVVVARNGQLIWADIFAGQKLFASYWPKLLKSYVIDALGDNTSEKRPTTQEAARYLEGRDGTVSTTTQAGVYQLVKTESSSYAVFDLRDISLANTLSVHFNKMDR